MSDETSTQAAEPDRRPLPEAAKRALAEAAARKFPATPGEKEYNGRQGLDPVRYGDWEIKGLACDF